MNIKRHNFTIFKIVTAMIILSVVLVSCATNDSLRDQDIARVKKGDITSDIEIRGKLEMPREIKLHFATYGVIQKLYVSYGSKVNAGTLLAKLDDTSQKQAVEQAQYSVEIAMNELVEKTYSNIMGYPYYYPSIGIVLRFEAAQKEVSNTQDLLQSGNYRQSMTALRLAIHDLEACLQLLQPPADISSNDYYNVFQAIDMVKTDLAMLQQDTEIKLSVQSMISKGLYDDASIRLATVVDKLTETHILLNGIVGVIKSYFPLYPDTSTSLDITGQVKDALEQVQTFLKQEDHNSVETAEKLRLAIHDLEMSNDILEGSELIFNHGLNLKVLRLNNLNLEKAENVLESAKIELMKTEIIAPFDGVIVDVPVKENDELSAVDYNSRTIVDMVDISRVELWGYVDEVDVRSINSDDARADVYVDVVPGEKFNGRVAFVSPYGSLPTLQTGTASFLVQIVLDPTDTLLQRGLSATAVIPVGTHEDVLIIPSSAIRFSQGECWVGIVKNQSTGEIEKREVSLGLQNDDFVEVVSGLKENEVVALQRLHE